MSSSQFCPEGYIEIFCIVIRETGKALYCEFGDCLCWIPKSQIHDNSEVYKLSDKGEIMISEWIANEKGLI